MYVRSGHAAQVIVQTARSREAGLIVMSTHGRGGLDRWLHGSVADQVLRETPQPVILVPPGYERPWPGHFPLRILLTLDGSALAEAAIGPADDLAGALGAALMLVRVVEHSPPDAGGAGPRITGRHFETKLSEAQKYLREVEHRLQTDGRLIAVRITVGHPATAITTIARMLKVHLLVMATHGCSGLARVVLGSVATETL